jgi:hypothetical protein
MMPTARKAAFLVNKVGSQGGLAIMRRVKLKQ